MTNATALWVFDYAAEALRSDKDARQELRQAFFAMVAPEGNWKAPIRATIDAMHFADCSAAAAFFTGAPLAIAENIAGDRLVVTGPGYYATIGA